MRCFFSLHWTPLDFWDDLIIRGQNNVAEQSTESPRVFKKSMEVRDNPTTFELTDQSLLYNQVARGRGRWFRESIASVKGELFFFFFFSVLVHKHGLKSFSPPRSSSDLSPSLPNPSTTIQVANETIFGKPDLTSSQKHWIPNTPDH